MTITMSDDFEELLNVDRPSENFGAFSKVRPAAHGNVFPILLGGKMFSMFEAGW